MPVAMALSLQMQDSCQWKKLGRGGVWVIEEESLILISQNIYLYGLVNCHNKHI